MFRCSMMVWYSSSVQCPARDNTGRLIDLLLLLSSNTVNAKSITANVFA